MDCGNCGEPDADASLFGLILCPRCYSRMSAPRKYDDGVD